MHISNAIVGLVVGVIALCVLVLLAVTLFSSRYLRFMAKDKAYFSEVAHACDSILRHHPVSSNDTVTLYGHMSLPYTMKLSGHDGSLPKIIKRLHPDMVLISTNRVLIDIPPERMGGFVITWEADHLHSNL